MIILGSSSSSRAAVLRGKNVPFKTVAPDIDEKAIRTENIFELPVLIARAKMAALKSKVQGKHVVITADQVIKWDRELREKPRDSAELRKYIESYSGSVLPAQCINAVVVSNMKNGQTAEGKAVAYVYFNKIPPEQIDRIVADPRFMKQAGGIITEDPLMKPYIFRIAGGEDAVWGLPFNLLKELFEKVGAKLPVQ